ncbi:hypothetical protein BU23DRAFT_472784 [Bimuria novae-zelandiae CBS 107.79]|uniref:Uncharacterized protein n=1 Tax=Bimuria novae-zelandiae CBS 107.79 TaxID=1447943 RepID=A0A6A5V0G4_9PLEO|nr:hypothetical protein BU23DRAFT_472784 [Bimuria novae-zelandiae CBS 107.79]
MVARSVRNAPPFGFQPFDHFIMDKWDPFSTLSQKVQHKALVAVWISLGRYGRNVYFGRVMTWFRDSVVPKHIPQDLLTSKQQAQNGELYCAYWIRTWYGSEDGGSGGSGPVTRATADACYDRLYRKAILDIQNEQNEPAIFDDDPESFGMVQHSREQYIPPAGTVPSALAGAFMRVSDSFDGIGLAKWRSDDSEMIAKEEERLENIQYVLVLLADREACERGWGLFLGITHTGQVMPLRVRTKACNTRDQVNQWLGLGNPVDVIPEDRQNKMIYDDLMGDSDGWSER